MEVLKNLQCKKTRRKIFLCLVFLFFFLNQASALSFKFGRSGKITYDLKSGTFNVYVNDDEILTNGFSTFKADGRAHSSKQYTQRSYSSLSISDRFGKGIKHIISLSAAGRPGLKQVFYTYAHLPYFLCEIEISGKPVRSNEMVPLQGGLPVFKDGRNLRTLFVPFDNDTFISYHSKLFSDHVEQVSAEVGVVYNDSSFKGLIAGSVNHRVWKTGVFTDRVPAGNAAIRVQAGFTRKDVTRDVIPHGVLKGAVLKSPLVFYGLFEDWRMGMDAYAKANRIAEPPLIFKWDRPTPLGWNSWGAMQEKISFNKIVKVTDFFADSLKAFRSGGSLYIDLDSYWDNMLDGGLEGDYSKLKALAAYVKKRGLKPGIYWAPFTDWGYQSGGNRRVEGGNYKFSELWTKVGQGYHDLDGARALDPTHPGTQQRIALVIGKLKACGYEMIKIDFLGHAAIESGHFYDPRISTGMQAYEAGMSFLLKQLAGKMLIYAAISPTMASGRYVHMRRIACDAFKSVSDTKYTLNSLTYGWWQTHLYDYVDADHVVLGTESPGANRARTLSAIVTGTFIAGDDFSAKGQWCQRALELFQNQALLAVMKDGKAFKPLEANKEASEMFVRQSGAARYLAIFNYADKEKKFRIDAAAIGSKTLNGYRLEDLFTGKTSFSTGKAEFALAGGDATLIKITK